MRLQALLDHRFEPQRVRYSERDTILYALSVGAGQDPLDPHQLRLVYEQGLLALPTMAAVLAQPVGWIANPVFEVDYRRLLHGEQHLTVHRSLPPGGELEATYRVPAVLDKGPERGALVYFEKQLKSGAGGELLCTVLSTLFLRADGGCGSFGTAPFTLPQEPLAAPEFVEEITTPRNAGLLYRLNGDRNPIHVDPGAARQAGFERPILHGLCSYGIAGYLLTRAVCAHEPARLRTLGVRFTAPVYPGETLRIEGRRGADGVRFQAWVPERGQLVLGQGCAQVA